MNDKPIAARMGQATTLYKEVLRSDWDKAQATIEQQAREIERLSGSHNDASHYAARNEELRAEIERLEAWKAEEVLVMSPLMDYARSVCNGPLGCGLAEWLVQDHKELAALRAQQPGVVLPASNLAQRIDQAITDFTRGRASMHVPPLDTDLDVVLGECRKLVKRFNSSPVSAAIAPTIQQLALALSRVEALHELSIDLIAEDMHAHLVRVIGAQECGKTGGSGGVDERAEFEVRFHNLDLSKRQDDEGDTVYVDDLTQGAFIGWQARAALMAGAQSVPDHGCEDWSVFVGYLIDRCEGYTVAEESLQGWLAEMIADPHYGALFRREKTADGNPVDHSLPIAMAIEAAEEERGSLRAAAKAIGVDAGYLSRLKSGEKLNPGDDVLSALGLERITMYRAAAPAPGKGGDSV